MKRRIVSLLAIILVILALALSLDLLDFSTKTSYQSFQSALEKDEVTSVAFNGDKLSYTTKDAKGTFSTTNPESPTLKEELLKKGIEVKASDTSFNAISDAVFNVIFFGLVIFGAYKLYSYSSNTFKVVRHTGVKFSDIAGMEELKKEMLHAVSILKDGGKGNVRETRGIILEGLPGNGKTLFAKALAEEADVRFIATKGADFQGAVMGLGAFKVKMLFSKARRKKPCIVFIDEFDSIGERRNYAGSGIDKENNRILTTLLNEMDGFTRASGVLVIAATNSYDSLDPALIRPGRFDLKYTIGNPDKETRRQLVEIYTRNRKLTEDLNPEVLSIVFDGLSSAAIETVLNEAQAVTEMKGLEAIGMPAILFAAQRTAQKLNVKIKKN